MGVGIKLASGQSVPLMGTDGSTPNRARIGVGWETTRGMFGRPKAVHLDASAIVFGADHRLLDKVWCHQPRSLDGAVVHIGDGDRSRDAGDIQSILVDLDDLDPRATTVVVAVSSFNGQTFANVESAYCRVVDLDTAAELARCPVRQPGLHNAHILGKLTRGRTCWAMTAIGHRCQSRSFRDLVPAVAPFL